MADFITELFTSIGILVVLFVVLRWAFIHFVERPYAEAAAPRIRKREQERQRKREYLDRDYKRRIYSIKYEDLIFSIFGTRRQIDKKGFIREMQQRMKLREFDTAQLFDEWIKNRLIGECPWDDTAVTIGVTLTNIVNVDEPIDREGLQWTRHNPRQEWLAAHDKVLDDKSVAEREYFENSTGAIMMDVLLGIEENWEGKDAEWHEKEALKLEKSNVKAAESHWIKAVAKAKGKERVRIRGERAVFWASQNNHKLALTEMTKVFKSVSRLKIQSETEYLEGMSIYFMYKATVHEKLGEVEVGKLAKAMSEEYKDAFLSAMNGGDDEDA